jgi:hypothetical protein
LPAVGLLTICVVSVSAELISRWLYPVTQVGFENCFAINDPTGDAAVKPNGVCWERTVESPEKTEYRFNSSGHRAGIELQPKAPGSFRIVLIGSSFTQGLFVPREKTFAALLPQELSIETGRKIEVYNEATGGKFRGGPYPTQDSAEHFDQVLAAQPDLILWVITPGDIVNAETRDTGTSAMGATQESPQPTEGSARSGSLWKKLVSSVANGTFVERLKSRWEDTRTSAVLKHFAIASKTHEEYVKSFLSNEDDSNVLKKEPSSQWQMQLQAFEVEAAEIVGRADSAKVPMVAAFVPNRPLAAMLSDGTWPAGYDPFKVDGEIRDNVVNHGGRFVDILDGYRGMPGVERNYFPVDGHPNAEGHSMISRLLSKGLSSGAVPELSAVSQPHNTAPQGH